jgi:hypothetical protein
MFLKNEIERAHVQSQLTLSVGFFVETPLSQMALRLNQRGPVEMEHILRRFVPLPANRRVITGRNCVLEGIELQNTEKAISSPRTHLKVDEHLMHAVSLG